MNNLGILPSTLADYQLVLDSRNSGAETATEIEQETGFSRSKVYRALQYHGIRLERQPLNESCAYNIEPYTLPVLDDSWKAAFQGFFYGEGWIGLANFTGSYSPRMNINLRIDDEPILVDIHSKLGGTHCTMVRSDGHTTQSRWHLSGWPRVRAVIEAIFLNPILPAKKQRDIDLVYEAILTRYQMGHWFTPDDLAVLQSYYERSMAIKRFSC